MKENVAVQAIREQQVSEWEAGFWEGLECNPNVLPPFYFKSYSELIPRQRGWIFGRELQLQERGKG